MDTSSRGAPEAAPATGGAAPSPGASPAHRIREGNTCFFGEQATIRGTPFPDRIRGTRGADVIVSLGGNDVISGLNEGDLVCTGTGNDRVVEERRSFDEIRINLGPGDDRMTVLNPIDTILAGAGDDTILIARNSWPAVAPGPGDDLIRAVDVRRAAFMTTCVRLGSASGPVRVNLALGRATGQGRDRLVNIRCVAGSRFNDVLIGTPRNDSIDAGGGLDLVRAGAGNDDVYGGDRADEVHLGPGDDEGDGAYGWDRLYGGPGADAVTGGPDGDYIDGGTGDDYLYAGVDCDGSSPPGGSTAWMLMEMLTNGGPNEVFGRTGNDFLAGDRGNDRLDGGTGFDSGTGGYHDGRIDWITSLERFDECDSR